MNHYPRHIGDWMVATAHLSEIEECMYSRLVDCYYSREAPLPLNLAACCRLVRAASLPARKAVEVVLREFFRTEATGWHQKRCDEEIAAYREKCAKASQSASVRWSERNANAYANVHAIADANAMRTQSVGNANQNQEPRKASTRRKKSAAVPLPNDFGISDRVRRWAAEKGFHALDKHLESFVSKAKAKGYTYVDWDEAFMGAIRENWGDIPPPPPPKRVAL